MNGAVRLERRPEDDQLVVDVLLSHRFGCFVRGRSLTN